MQDTLQDSLPVSGKAEPVLVSLAIAQISPDDDNRHNATLTRSSRLIHGAANVRAESVATIDVYANDDFTIGRGNGMRYWRAD